MVNNPINASDPSGHKCVGEPEECLNSSGRPINGASGVANAAARKGSGNPGSDKPLKALKHKPQNGGNSSEIDGLVLSGNVTLGFTLWVSSIGFDLVFNKTGVVVFFTGGTTVDDPTHSTAFLTPQAGGAVTLGTVTSNYLQSDSSLEDVEIAYAGRARQTGASISFLTENQSSSLDPDGTSNYQTRTRSLGFSGGVPGIDYHTFESYSDPVTEVTWDQINSFLQNGPCVGWC